ncbi:hypothetical protein BWI15_31005 [Kribbella sp. ALI-6-A]|uniref:hypothetical protein n=1 Tax=Kribbella sp. ALI-6-A TaxID=1933817 RepID=UPI00097C7EC4|nr:hypothetical protein [Kribbella sp. ALI-6-A]ONI67546.1 hypothetical protein BWI15_31005 [Kribbella sp. ALI-6-A]
MREYDRLVRELAEQAVIDEAEHAAAGRRRMIVMHGLTHEQHEELNELIDFVNSVCRRNRIETWGGVTTANHPVKRDIPRRRWTRWVFAPPYAFADLAAIEAALRERHPDWLIVTDDDLLPD